MLESWIDYRIASLDISKANTVSVLGTQKRYTRLMNCPESATLRDLLRLSSRIDVHPVYLYLSFDFAARNLTDEDVQLLRQHYTVTPQDSQTTPHHEYPNLSDDQPADQTGNPARRAAPESARREASIP